MACMKFRREIVPAHRTYYINLIRPNGELVEWYLPYAFHTREEAQAECDTRNPHYSRTGHLEVGFRDYPQSIGSSATLKLSTKRKE